MTKEIIVSLVIIAIITTVYLLWRRKQKKYAAYKLPSSTKNILLYYVPFYRNLSEASKTAFEERVRDFLARTKITGVNHVLIEDVDRIFIAASAVMLLYAYPKTRYYNIDEILVYPGSFNRQYDTEGPARNIAGMVGTGVLHRQMILSQAAIRAAFVYPDNTQNTIVHEFAHLIDKADGAIDGVPDYLLNKNNKQQWKNISDIYIKAIKLGITDINPYGATNPSEFFAVISEYYFKQPIVMKRNYPQLFEMLDSMYKSSSVAA